LTQVRAIRDAIERRVQAFIAAKGWSSPDRTASGLTIAPAKGADESAVRALLAAAELPLEGLEIAFPAGYAIARRTGVVVGCAGLETYDRDGLLRSVAVSASERGSGIGAALVADRLSAAKNAGLDAVYLLTTTAPDFFRRLGFEPWERRRVPPAVEGSPEFAEICPSSAACLRWRVRE
jgi:amino-acid N-acetyltransferase